MRLPRMEMTFQKWAIGFQGEQTRIYRVPEKT
jgi:hypothetical protein